MKRLLPALAMAALIHAALFVAGARWLTDPKAVAPRTQVITMQLVEVAPPSPAAMRSLPASPPSLPPAPKKPIVSKPAPKPKPVVKKTRAAKKPPSAEKAPQPVPPKHTAHVFEPQPKRPAAVANTPPPPPEPAATPSNAVSRSIGRDSYQAPGETTAVTSVVMATPRYSDNPPPTYPALARKRGYQGTVVLEVFVKTDGRVGDLRIVESSTHTLLDRAATNAVKGWQFEPGRRGDRVVAMWVRVPVRFALN